jgi:type II secretory ATPase GspE/PulE/Tfp pilus assembly ATPase PilB-like protein
LSLEDGVLTVAHLPGLDGDVLVDLGILVGYEVQGVVLERRAVEEMWRSKYGVGSEAIVRSAIESQVSKRRAGAKLRKREGENASVVELVDHILSDAVKNRATDVHLEPFESYVRARMRIDGVLHEMPLPLQMIVHYRAIVNRFKVLAALDISEKRLPQDGRFERTYGSQEYDCRLSILPTPHGESVNVRILDGAELLKNISTLGLDEEALEVVSEVLALPHGVVLVSGPTGSGKTTTLYTFLNRLNSMERKVLSIEDPVEYRLPGVTQLQIHPRIQFGFAVGLRSMLRHDPDVMMVGEIRDRETAETVTRVALTGHLVFSTVHTNDAPSTPARLVDMGVEPYLLASSLECIIAQRLVRVLCKKCRCPSEREWTKKSLGLSAVHWMCLGKEGPVRWMRGAGCEHCRHTGFRGRTGVFEIMRVSSEIRACIARRATADEIAQVARRSRSDSLRWKSLMLASRGETTVEEALRVSKPEDW